MRGFQEKKEVLLELLEQGMSVPFRTLHFGYADPLPDTPVSLNFMSRLIIPLAGRINLVAAYDQQIEERKFVPGDLLFTGVNGWACSVKRGDYKSISVVFMDSFIRLVMAEIRNGEIIYNPWYHTANGPHGVTLHIINALNALMRESGDGKRERGKLLLRSLVEQVKCDVCNELPAVSCKSAQTFLHIQQYICHNFHQPISRKTISDAFNLNPCYVSTLFKKYSQDGLNDYLNRLRMEKAGALLKSSLLTNKQIALLCGFTSQEYFVKYFKKFYGTTPGQYRLD